MSEDKTSSVRVTFELDSPNYTIAGLSSEDMATIYYALRVAMEGGHMAAENRADVAALYGQLQRVERGAYR